jgi:hypothetical protein
VDFQSEAEIVPGTYQDMEAEFESMLRTARENLRQWAAQRENGLGEVGRPPKKTTKASRG